MMQLWTWVDPWLFLFSFSLTSFIPFAVWRAGSALPPCLEYKYRLKWHVWFSWYLYCCAGNIQGCRLGAMGASYNGWVRMCCSLAMAEACAKHRPCYWFQTYEFKIQWKNYISSEKRGCALIRAYTLFWSNTLFGFPPMWAKMRSGGHFSTHQKD